MSIWTGNSAESWFNSTKLAKRRTLLRCERENKLEDSSNGFYTVSVDVARYDANTAITVIKALPQTNGFKKNVVYVEVIHGENYITVQAPRIKKLIQLYQPREVVIDGNGPGIGLLDAMILPSIDPKTGEQFPPYYAFNNDHHLPPAKRNESNEPWPDEPNAIIYDIKAGSSNNDEIHANLFTQLNNGSVSFLANEGVVKTKMEGHKKWQKMSFYDQRVFLLPYEMTSRLMDELNNLKLKPTGAANQFVVERISRSIEKDRVSSLEYGLYRIKYYEDQIIRKSKKHNFNQYAFFTPRKRG